MTSKFCGNCGKKLSKNEKAAEKHIQSH